MQIAVSAAQQAALLTTRDVQRLIRVDRSTIYRMAEDGRLPAIKVGRQWRFPEDRLREWLGTEKTGQARERDGGLAALGPGTLQAVSDFLGEALGSMVVLAELGGRPLADPGNPCGLFTAAHHHAGVLDHCIAGWRALAAEVDFEPQWRVTPFGFLCARSLVRQGGRLVGAVVAGGVAPPIWPPDAGEASRLAAQIGVPARVFQEHADEVHRLDPAEQDRVLRLLPRAATFLSRLAADQGHLAGRLEAIAALAVDPAQRSDS